MGWGIRASTYGFGGDSFQSTLCGNHLVRTQTISKPLRLLSILKWPYFRRLLPRNRKLQIIMIWLRSFLKNPFIWKKKKKKTIQVSLSGVNNPLLGWYKSLYQTHQVAVDALGLLQPFPCCVNQASITVSGSWANLNPTSTCLKLDPKPHKYPSLKIRVLSREYSSLVY